MNKPIVALVGRPNVGKSTLFNRLAVERLAVTDHNPGTTRDRLTAESDWNGVCFDIVDTGGLEADRRISQHQPLASDSANFITMIQAQTEIAISEADVIVFMVDVAEGLTAADLEIAQLVRRRQRRTKHPNQAPVILAVNKSDNQARREITSQFYELGLGHPYPISALHGIGTGDLLDAVVDKIPGESEETENDSVKIAIVGRPNVGKSSLVNRLLGEERVIVSPLAGTTRDAIDTQLTYDDTAVTLIDTVGMRRRGKIGVGVEKYGVLRALKAIGRSEIALLLVDATDPFTAQDSHIAGMILSQARSAMVLVNKWDAIEKDTHTIDQYRNMHRHKLRFLDYAPLLFISVLNGQRVDQVLPTALQVHAERQHRVPTAELNKLVRDAIAQHAPPSRAGKRLRVFYAAQVANAPPMFLFHVNDRSLVHFSYTRYLENSIRKKFSFRGTPLRLSFRERNE